LFCLIKKIDLTYSQKDMLSSQVSRILDQNRVLSYDEYVELLDHNESLETYSSIEFNDEILSIEEIPSIEMIDFEVSGNNLFFANDILTHNSAINQTESVDNSSISDSIGTAMTADFMLFLLQDESMKEQKEIVCKVTKNRFTGITDTWMMSIDYEHMRFEDKLVQGSPEAMEILDSTVNAGPSVLDDFGIVTAEKQERAEVYANNEIKEIVHEDIKNIQKADKKDPFNNDMDDLFKDLGID